MVRFATLLAILIAVLGCSSASTPNTARPEPSQLKAPPTEPNTTMPRRLTSEYLPNAVRIHEKVISGGLPEGDAAFKELADLGVKTIISVDGAKPDVGAAKKHGLRYVHLPHGYDGIPDERVKELAKAVRDLDGLIFIHCHHGKHRSPAAAAVACVSAGLIQPSQAIPILQLAGTSPNYRGLYQSAETAHALEAALLDELKVEFRETIDVPPLAEAMVQIEHTHDHLKRIAEAGWKTPTNHPDLDPVHEALLMREHFTELLRTDEVRQQPSELLAMLRDSETTARQLEESLEQWQEAPDIDDHLNRIDATANHLSANCKACHNKYRDVPLSEKS